MFKHITIIIFGFSKFNEILDFMKTMHSIMGYWVIVKKAKVMITSTNLAGTNITNIFAKIATIPIISKIFCTVQKICQCWRKVLYLEVNGICEHL